MTDLGVLFAIGVFAAWFLLTFIRQLPQMGLFRFSQAIPWLPNYRFFADPPAYDFRLFFRFSEGEGGIGSWQELQISTQRRPSSAIWNPDRRSQRAAIDCCTTLLALARSACARTGSRPELIIHTSISYLTLLNHVSALSSSEVSRSYVQFAIFSDTGTCGSMHPEFVSSVHRLASVEISKKSA